MKKVNERILDDRLPNFFAIQDKLGLLYYPYMIDDKSDHSSDEKYKKIKEHYEILMSIGQITYRLYRYEKYFKEFYVESDEINDIEALEYHIHGYITDVYVWREKLKTYVGILKKDVKKITADKGSVDEAFGYLVDNIIDGAKEITEVRRSHTHNGPLFGDLDVSTAKALNTLLETQAFPEEYNKEKLITLLGEKKEASLSKAKEKWSDNVKSNNESMIPYLDGVMSKLKKYIFAVFDIE